MSCLNCRHFISYTTIHSRENETGCKFTQYFPSKASFFLVKQRHFYFLCTFHFRLLQTPLTHIISGTAYRSIKVHLLDSIPIASNDCFLHDRFQCSSNTVYKIIDVLATVWTTVHISLWKCASCVLKNNKFTANFQATTSIDEWPLYGLINAFALLFKKRS